MSKSTRFEKIKPRVESFSALIVWSIDCSLFFAVKSSVTPIES